MRRSPDEIAIFQEDFLSFEEVERFMIFRGGGRGGDEKLGSFVREKRRD